ncbi:winged helix-turn-helix transcriptional regulator [Haladaptatus sp. NG-WS-4]
MAVNIDRPGVVLLVALLCLPSLAVAIPDGETAGTPLNETNTTTVAVTTTKVDVSAAAETTIETTDTTDTDSTESTVVGSETDGDTPTTDNTTDSTGSITNSTDTVGDTTDTVDGGTNTTDETIDAIEDTANTTQTGDDSLDGTGDTVETDTGTTDVVDSSTGDLTDGVDGTNTTSGDTTGETAGDTTDAVGDTATATESGAIGGSDTTSTNVAAATTTVTSAVDTVTETAASAGETGTEDSEAGDGKTTTETVADEGTTATGVGGSGGREPTEGTGGDARTVTTGASSGVAASSGERSANGDDGGVIPDGPIPISADSAGFAGAILALGLASHLPDVTALTVNAGTGRGTSAVVPAVAQSNGRFWRIVTPFRYSRYDDSDPLEHEVRGDLYEKIERAPGLYLSELDDRLDVSLSTIRHHLRVLEREGMVTGAKVRGKRRFYPDEEGVELAAALAEEPTAAVLDAVSRREPASVGELADELERDPSTVTHHLKRLEADGLVERERDGRAVVNRLSPEAKTAFSGGSVASADD